MKKTLEFYKMIIVFRSVLHEGKKYYPQVFLDEFMYKLPATHKNNFSG